MTRATFRKLIFCAMILTQVTAHAQESLSRGKDATVSAHLVAAHAGKSRSVPAVIWLESSGETISLPFRPEGRYSLLQKNRTFFPHLQVIPVGSVVQFPNADPFFHNVFSLFDGKRFDLGLYEAGSSKSVTFSREGISYIFCNIHPEMSAVVIALSTPLYAVATPEDSFTLHTVPPGKYKLHIWIEGVPQAELDRLTRNIEVVSGTTDLGQIVAPIPARGNMTHTNEFGKSYSPESKSTY